MARSLRGAGHRRVRVAWSGDSGLQRCARALSSRRWSTETRCHRRARPACG